MGREAGISQGGEIRSKGKITFQIEGMAHPKSPEVGESKVNWRD